MFKTYEKQIWIASCAYLGHILFGVVGGWSAAFLDKIAAYPNLLGEMDATKMNFLVAGIFLGAMVATVPSGSIANIIGRKPTLMIAGLLAAVSFLCTALVLKASWTLVFRFLHGISIGVIMPINIVYLGEIASTEVRGILLGTIGVFNALGFVIAYAVGPFVSYAVFNYVGFGISMAYFAGMFYIPESPVFYLKKGRYEEAKATLIYLNRQKDADKVSEMKLEEESTSGMQWSKLITVKGNRKALTITSLLFILQQFSGIGAVIAYCTKIFELSGSSIPPHIATIITGLVLMVSSMITPIFIERSGRKILLILSTMACCISLAVLSIYLNLDYYGFPLPDGIKWLPLCMVVVYIVSYSSGFGIIPEALVGEMFQLQMRSPGTSIVLLVSYSSGFLTVYAFGYLISLLGIHNLFIIFSAVCGVATVFTWSFVPETKGKSLMEVQKMLDQ